jgi:hypothetical protein
VSGVELLRAEEVSAVQEESPGRKGVTTSPVSQKTIRKSTT